MKEVCDFLVVNNVAGQGGPAFFHLVCGQVTVGFGPGSGFAEVLWRCLCGLVGRLYEGGSWGLCGVHQVDYPFSGRVSVGAVAPPPG